MHAPVTAAAPGQPPEPLHTLLDPALMQRLMRRTGTGSSMTIRALSDASGVPRSTVHKMLSGAGMSIPAQAAHSLAHSIGVDLLVLFAPVGRSVAEVPEQRAVSA